MGNPVEVPFDETIVKYLWVEDRKLEIIAVELIQNKLRDKQIQRKGRKQMKQREKSVPAEIKFS